MNENKRIAFLKDNIMGILLETRKSYKEYAQIYGHTRDGVRKWWRSFLDLYKDRGEWFTGNNIEPDWFDKIKELDSQLNGDKQTAHDIIHDSDIPKEKWVEDFDSKMATFIGYSDTAIKSEEEALIAFNIDRVKWEVSRLECNVWTVTGWKTENKPIRKNNYQVKLILKPRELKAEEIYEKAIEALKDVKPYKILRKLGKKVGIVNAGDFHLGADVRDLPRTKDFNLDILIGYLHEMTDIINEQGFDEVHVNLIGDFFESISGISKLDTHKSNGYGMWGANLIILAEKVYSEHFLSRIVNLTAINYVTGNHDRMMANSKEENTGEGGKLLMYLLSKGFPEVKITGNSLINVVKIDGMNFILSHGEKSLSNKDATKIIFDYGDPNIYNIVIKGHLHSLKKSREYKEIYFENEMIGLDELKYTKITLRPIFTGNYYSEQLGFAGPSGFTIITNNGKGMANINDIIL